MRISYLNEKLRKLCEIRREAEQKLGADCAKKLRTRLSDLDATPHVRKLIVGHPHPLERDRLGQFAINLTGGKRLVFVPDHQPIPNDDQGNIDWSQITAITIVFIGDYHD